MKNIFLKPIGTVRDLGTPREWIGDALVMVAWAIIIIAALILL